MQTKTKLENEIYSEVEILNSIVRNNMANGTFDEIYTENGSSVFVEYSNISGGWQGDGNIDLDPLFVGSGDQPFALQDDSPCVNTGTPDISGFNLPTIDLAGNSRLYGGRIEMGAYENQNVIVSVEDVEIQGLEFDIQCYPNPVNQKATIEFVLKETEYINVSIHNLLGQEVASLVSEILPAGKHRIVVSLQIAIAVSTTRERPTQRQPTIRRYSSVARPVRCANIVVRRTPGADNQSRSDRRLECRRFGSTDYGHLRLYAGCALRTR